MYRKYMHRRYIEVKEYVEKHDKELIADLGIGKGYYYYNSTVNKANVVGIDIGQNNLNKLATHSPEIKTYLRDVRDTGLPDKTYDLVVISQVLEHFEDYTPIIKEAKRICKDDGYFLIGVPIEIYDRRHFFPVWNFKDVLKLSEQFGEIIELKKLSESWLVYIKNV